MDSAYERLLASDQARGRTYIDDGWLPPEDQCPELAPLRAEHLRLLGVVAEAAGKLANLTRETQMAEDQRADAMRDAILAGTDPAKVKVSAPDPDELERARREHEVAVEALAIFVQRALAEIDANAGEIEAGVAGRLREAEAKRREARRLLVEADRLAAQPERLLRWLDRYVTVENEFGERRKRSVLGPIAFSSTDLPTPVAPPPLIAEMVLGPGEVEDVGTDDLTTEEQEAIINA